MEAVTLALETSVSCAYELGHASSGRGLVSVGSARVDRCFRVLCTWIASFGPPFTGLNPGPKKKSLQILSAKKSYATGLGPGGLGHVSATVPSNGKNKLALHDPCMI